MHRDLLGSPEVAQLRLGSALLFADRAVAGEGHVSTDPAVLHGSLRAAGGHDLLAGQAAVGPAQASLVRARAAAVAESPVEDVLRAHAAVGGLAEQVRVVPPVFALAEELLHVGLPLGSLRAAPQREQHRDRDGHARPEQQRPLIPHVALLRVHRRRQRWLMFEVKERLAVIPPGRARGGGRGAPARHPSARTKNSSQTDAFGLRMCVESQEHGCDVRPATREAV